MRGLIDALGVRGRIWLSLQLLLVVLLVASGCTTAPLQYQSLEQPRSDEASSVELLATPFFPQQAYHCGPAALATLLQTSGAERITPDLLADQVYLPNQRGSLQTELIAATRRADRVPYVLEPSLEHLLTEIRAGNPVLVLQNLALPRWPKWHYAVVIGFDLDNEEILLRSGTTEREVLSLKHFERTWQWGNYWALVVPPPQQIPATATATRFLEAVAYMELQQRWDIAARSYLAAAKQWPDNPISHLGLGNIAYQQAAYAEAEIRFQTAIDIAPDAPAAHYNLAWAKLRQGKTADARLAAQMAETLSPDHPRFGNAVAAIEAEAAKMQAH